MAAGGMQCGSTGDSIRADLKPHKMPLDGEEVHAPVD